MDKIFDNIIIFLMLSYFQLFLIISPYIIYGYLWFF
jgi:hypothetical protein